MKCICCVDSKDLVDSHVISKFVRMAITGIGAKKAKKFSFQWCGRRDLPRQDLPKPKLMCDDCDNGFGGTIENPASRILLPAGDLGNVSTWNKLACKTRTVTLPLGKNSMQVWEYQIDDPDRDCVLRKFSVLTAWRALHAMAADGQEDVARFMRSEDGPRIKRDAVEFLMRATQENYLVFPYPASLYFLGPASAAVISGSDDEVPFAWTFIETETDFAVAVIMGFWVIIWPLLPDLDPRRNSSDLLNAVFIDWHTQVHRQMVESRKQ